MNQSTRFLSLFSPPPILRAGPLTNLHRLHRRFLRCLFRGISPRHRSSGSIVTEFPSLRLRLSSFSSPPLHQLLPEWAELIKSLSKAGYFTDSAPSSGFEKRVLSRFTGRASPSRYRLLGSSSRSSPVAWVSFNCRFHLV